MLGNALILVIEDDPYLALDLSATIEELDGRVAGPTHDVGEALELLDTRTVEAAIVDWHLPKGSSLPVADWLAERAIPFVIHATERLSRGDRERHGDVPLLMKPLQPRTVIARLVVEMRKLARHPVPIEA